MTLFAISLGWLVCAVFSGLGLSLWWALPIVTLAGVAVPARARPLRFTHAAAALLTAGASMIALGGSAGPAPATSVARLAGRQARLLVTVSAAPDPHPGYVALNADAVAQEQSGEWQPASGRLLLIMPATEGTVQGATLQIDGLVQTPDSFGSEGYRTWLNRQGIVASIAFPRAAQIATPTPSPLTAAGSAVRARVQNGLSATLPAPDAALAFALVFGGRHALPAGIAADLAASGLAHLAIVAAFNVLLLYGVLLACLTPLAGRGRAAAIAALVAIGYGVFAGGGASALRGEVLVLALAVATIAGRPRDPVQLLVVSAALLTLGNAKLLFDAGFQLTFTGAAGIGLLARPLQTGLLRLFGRVAAQEKLQPAAGALLEGLCASAGAALLAIPVEAAVFHSTSLYGAVANSAVNPLVPAATLLAAGTGLVGSTSAAAAAPFAALLWLLMRVIELIAKSATMLPGARLSLPQADSVFASVWYGALLLLFFVFRRKAAPFSRRQPRSLRRLPRLPGTATGHWLPRRGTCMLAACVITASVVVVVLGVRSGTPAGGTSVRWLVAGQPSLLVHGRSGTRVLVADVAEPSRLAAALQQADGAGAFVDLLVFPRAPVDDAELNGMVSTAEALHAQAVMFPTPVFPLTERTRRGMNLVPVASSARVGLGRDDAIEFLVPASNGGGGPVTGLLRLTVAGTVLLVPSGSSTIPLLRQWDDPAGADVVTLLRGARASDQALLAELQPRAVVAETAAGEAVSVAGLAPAATALDLATVISPTLGVRDGVAALSFRGRSGR